MTDSPYKHVREVDEEGTNDVPLSLKNNKLVVKTLNDMKSLHTDKKKTHPVLVFKIVFKFGKMCFSF